MSIKLRNNAGDSSVTLVDGGGVGSPVINVDVRSLATDVNTSVAASTVATAVSNSATTAAINAAIAANAIVKADLEPYAKENSWSHRNKLMNGDFRIWQRGESFSGNEYTADRWGLYKGSGDMTLTRSTTSNDILSYDRLKLIVGTPDSSGQIYQKIEDVRTMQGKTATLSFWVYTSQDFKIEASHIFGSGSSTSNRIFYSKFTTTIVASTWTKVEVQIDIPELFPGDEILDGSFLQVTLFIGNNAGNTYLKYVQFEEGSFATPFEQRPIGYELSLCQRYCMKFSAERINSSFFGANAFMGSSTSGTVTIGLPGTPRITGENVGTLTRVGNMSLGGYASGGNSITSFLSRVGSLSLSIEMITTTSGLANNTAVRFTGDFGAYFLLDLEL